MATYCKVMVDIEHDLSLHKDCIYKVHANWQGPQLACIALSLQTEPVRSLQYISKPSGLCQ